MPSPERLSKFLIYSQRGLLSLPWEAGPGCCVCVSGPALLPAHIVGTCCGPSGLAGCLGLMLREHFRDALPVPMGTLSPAVSTSQMTPPWAGIPPPPSCSLGSQPSIPVGTHHPPGGCPFKTPPGWAPTWPAVGPDRSPSLTEEAVWAVSSLPSPGSAI